MHTDPGTLTNLVDHRRAELRAGADADRTRRRSVDRTPRTSRAARAGFLASLALGGAVIATGCEPPPPPPKVTCSGAFATIVGTSGNDTITGTDGHDVIAGLGGNDTITGVGGSDLICGGAGTDTVSGGPGEDFLAGGPGSDTIDGGADRDIVTYRYATSGVVVDLQAGRGGEADTIREVEGVEGSNFGDHLTGTDGPNVVYGMDGNDTMVGLAGNDTLVEYGSARTTNWFYGGPGDDELHGASDHDIVAFDTSPVTSVFVDLGAGVARGEGTDELHHIDDVIGSIGNDTLYGSPYPNRIDGGEGNDVVDGRAGNDVVDGGPGTDRATFAGAGTGVSVHLGNGIASGLSSGDDSILRVEDLTGTDFDDFLTGTTGPNTIDGSDGRDFCFSGGGGTDSFIRCE